MHQKLTNSSSESLENLIYKSMKYWVTGCLDAVSDDYFALPQQEVWQKVDEDAKKCTLPGAFSSWHEVNAVAEKVSESGCLDSRGFEQCIVFSNRGTEVKPLKQSCQGSILMCHQSVSFSSYSHLFS